MMVLFLADEHDPQPKPELNHTLIVPDNSFHDVTAFFCSVTPHTILSEFLLSSSNTYNFIEKEKLLSSSYRK